MGARDTIFALSSAPGRAAIAVVRVSGPKAREAIEALTGKLAPEARRASLRVLAPPPWSDSGTGEGDHAQHGGGGEGFFDVESLLADFAQIAAPSTASRSPSPAARGRSRWIDQALVLFFPAPDSATGEDVAEFHIHGGRAVTQAVLDALAMLPGLRPAERGAFTRRAVENGRLDLSQAEGLADLIDAETEAQRKQALEQYGGALFRLCEGWRGRLVRIAAWAEAAIDFSDEELDPTLDARVREETRALKSDIEVELAQAKRGEIVREGFHLAVIGPPNAGKSSLVNALARRDIAIVSETPGTTRDVLEARLDLDGYMVTVADTAGLREAAESIEAEGVRRALARAEDADLVLLVLDGSAADPFAGLPQALLSPPPPCGEVDPSKRSGDGSGGGNAATPPPEIALVLEQRIGTAEDARFRPPHKGEARRAPYLEASRHVLTVWNKSDLAWPAPRDGLKISVATGEGLDALRDALSARVRDVLETSSGEAPAITRLRHRVALEEAAQSLAHALEAKAPELVAENLRLALRAIGRVTGRVDVEDLLDAIFRDFCIGK